MSTLTHIAVPTELVSKVEQLVNMAQNGEVSFVPQGKAVPLAILASRLQTTQAHLTELAKQAGVTPSKNNLGVTMLSASQIDKVYLQNEKHIKERRDAFQDAMIECGASD